MRTEIEMRPFLMDVRFFVAAFAQYPSAIRQEVRHVT